jgi:aldose 1-epimerase
MPLSSIQLFNLALSTPNGLLKATVTDIGAALIGLTIDDIELIQTYDLEQAVPLCAGVVMAPWSNRLDGGQWKYQGKNRQFEINIPAQNNANHGLLLDHSYSVVAQTESSITLSATIQATDAYPFNVDTTVTYQLTEAGITVTHSAVNHSADAAPYGVGGHPYFKFSKVDSGDLTLSSEAATITTVNDRQIPIGTSPTLGSVFDLRGGVRLQDHFYDQNFTDLARDDKGLAHTFLLSEAGEGLDIWQDSKFKHVVIFTPGFFPGPDGLVHTAAIEPSTAAPNAFNTGEDVIWLETGVEFSGSWGVRVILSK